MILGGLVGSIGALFFAGLLAAHQYRNTYHFLVFLLPISGFIVGYAYNKWGKDISGGNNLIIDEINQPSKPISWLMAPFILIGTLMSHVCGASIGREGTAVQIGASIADQFSKILTLKAETRKTVLKSGVAAGFSAVFSTPIAGVIFAFEVSKTGKITYQSLFPVVMSSIFSYLVMRLFHLPHANYIVQNIPDLSFETVFWSILAGIVFGLCGAIFSLAVKYSSKLFSKINYTPYRPIVGGVIFVAIIFGLGYTHTERFLGLGIENIVFSFGNPVAGYDFAAKLFLTALLIGSGFKGGEVTPLFYTGATLGNSLSNVIPLPMDLLTGMGFIAVFAAAANTPLTTIIIGIELFGSAGMYYFAIVCTTAYLISGKTSIYSSQLIGSAKSLSLSFLENKKIG